MGTPAFRALQSLSQADDLRLLVIRIEVTPRGWASLLALRSAIEQIRASGKTVWVHLLSPHRDALVLASAADQIFGLPHSALFWNGLGNRMFFYAEFEKLGLVADVESAGSYKSLAKAMHTVSRFKTENSLQSIYSSLEDQVLDVMSRDLEIEVSELRQAFSESPLSSERAQEPWTSAWGLLFRGPHG